MPTIATPSTARELRPASLLRVLRAVHDSPVAPTRAMVTSQLRLGRGTAAVLVADLKERRLLAEADAGSRHGPGRPTAQLVPHPEGPLVLSAVVTHDGWTLDAVELGGGTVRGVAGRHDRLRSTRVLDAIAGAGREVVADLPGRVGAFCLSLPATVRRGVVAQAALLGWADVDALEPFRWLDAPLRLVNDATAAGIGEARRGAARGQDVVLHLHTDAGIGGTLLIGGVPVRDAQGAGGEFGHMPLAGGDRPCRCGARGCWDLDVGNLALAGTRAGPGSAGASVQRVAARILKSAQAGDPAALERVSTVAIKLGRGIGALVNAHDPELVTLSGSAATIVALVPDPLWEAYLGALMSFRRSSPPAIRASALAGAGQRLGTAEVAFDSLFTDALIR